MMSLENLQTLETLVGYIMTHLREYFIRIHRIDPQITTSSVGHCRQILQILKDISESYENEICVIIAKIAISSNMNRDILGDALAGKIIQYCHNVLIYNDCDVDEDRLLHLNVQQDFKVFIDIISRMLGQLLVLTHITFQIKTPLEIINLWETLIFNPIMPIPIDLKSVANTNEDCIICSDSLNTGAVVELNECGHKVHNECIQRWFLQKNENNTRKNTCPVCRRVQFFGKRKSKARLSIKRRRTNNRLRY